MPGWFFLPRYASLCFIFYHKTWWRESLGLFLIGYKKVIGGEGLGRNVLLLSPLLYAAICGFNYAIFAR